MLTQRCVVSTGHACTSTTSLGTSAYAYDGNDNVTSVSEARDGGTAVQRSYCYDPRNQLQYRNTGAACSAAAKDETYTFDAAGNRLSAVTGAGSQAWTYSPDGQVTGYDHDPAGRLTIWPFFEGSLRAIAYDAEGRLTETCDSACSSGSTRFFFTYDADGRRTQIVESDAGGGTSTELRYLDGRISAEYVDGTLERSYLTDEAGSVIGVTLHGGPDAGSYLVTWNGHGDALNLLEVSGTTLAVANSFAYDSWGTPTTHLHPGYGDLGFRFLYVGRAGVQWDAGLGLHLMGARHYSPALGRFLQPDPPALEENLYAYVANNPLTDSDPSGTWKPIRVSGGTPGGRGPSGMASGPQCVCASSSANGLRLRISLASNQQRMERGKPIAGQGTPRVLRDAPRLARQHGGRPRDWVKMTSSAYRPGDGRVYSQHWYQNIRNGRRVEFKTIIDVARRGGP